MNRPWLKFFSRMVLFAAPTIFSLAALAGELNQNSQTTATPLEISQAKEEREELKAKLLSEMRALRMWRITDELKLDEATAAKIFPLLSRYEDLERQASKDRASAMETLKKSIEQGAASAAILNPQLDRVVALRTRRGELDREKIEALRKILPPAGCAKLLLLQSTIDDEFRERIKRALPRPAIDHDDSTRILGWPANLKKMDK